MSEEEGKGALPRGTTEQNILHIRRQLAAIDTAIDTLRKTGEPVPTALEPSATTCRAS